MGHMRACFKRRDATLFCLTPNRGLKLTATITWSLRDRTGQAISELENAKLHAEPEASCLNLRMPKGEAAI